MWPRPEAPIRVRNLLAAVLLCAAQPAVAETVLKPLSPITWRDYLGVNVQFQYFRPDIQQKQMAMLDQLGLKWVRLTIHWPIIETQRDHYNLDELDGAMRAMAEHRYEILAYLVGSAPFASSAPPDVPSRDQYPPSDFSLFAQRMASLAQRYPQVGTWQVWNEPNIIWRPKENPESYARLLFMTAEAIRQVAPGKTIVSAGMAYYSQMHSTPGYMLKTLIDGGMARRDIVAAYHPYSQYPEGDSPPDRDFLIRAKVVNDTLHKAGVKRVWATEWGWSSYKGPVELQQLIGTDGQADLTLRRLALMSAMDYERIFLFNLSDLDERASPRDQGYGLVDLDAAPKPVYTALRNFLTFTGPSLQPAEPPGVTQVPADLYAVPWARPDGSRLLMAWSASSAHLNLPAVRAATLYDPLTDTRTELNDPRGVSLALKPSLQILSWNP